MLDNFGVEAELMHKNGNDVETLLPFNTEKQVLASDEGMTLYDVLPTVSTSDTVSDTTNGADAFYFRAGATVSVDNAVAALLTATS
jgi:hypothetical protein